MKVVADLEVHSKYARAVSSRMTLPVIAEWADKKGVDLVGTGDFTHPIWLREIKANLTETQKGIYSLKQGDYKAKFLLTSEVSCIYSYKEKTRKVHFMVFMPDLSSVEKFNEELAKRGAKLMSDGRPIIGMSLYEVASIALDANEKSILIPAHVWTPWFGFYGEKGGFDKLDEAFGDLTKYIPAVETGLSSDPAMNWKIAELTNRQIVSFGDAHSPSKLGREATIFDLNELTFDSVSNAIKGDKRNKIDYTIEFYPEEGKYHFSGHRKCKVVYSPKELKKKGSVCPVCGKQLTGGVMSRVEKLSSADIDTKSKIDNLGVRWIMDKNDKFPPYVMLVPLMEIISEVIGVGVNSKTVQEKYEALIESYGSEFDILLKLSLDDLGSFGDQNLVEGIEKVRKGDISIKPGYDGVFGEVKIWKRSKEREDESVDQTSLF